MSGVTISAIEAVPFRIPMRSVVKFSTGQLSAIEHVLVRARGDNGLVGYAEAPARPMVYGESVPSILHAVTQLFAPKLVGQDVFARERVWPAMELVEGNPTAKGAVDMALADLAARSVGMPLWRWLGGYTKEVEVCHLLGIGPPAEVAAQAEAMRARNGISTFKLKAGLDAVRDTTMIREVRRSLGPDVRLTVDCNHGYDAVTAARVLPQWEEADILFVEEPCPGWDVDGRALVARSTRLPLMADETCTNVHEVAAELRRGHVRFMSVKTARTGFAASARVVHLCEAAGVHTVIGSQGDSDLGALSAAHFQASHRATAQWAGELAFHLDVDGTLLDRPLEIVGGRLKLPDGPGLGAEVVEEKLERFRIG
jgi:L-alanine-DL-glutamate epimerase-like enolase superfamily enzyme